tara:strand:- start:1911 stop:2711 length:801 start_codon:yes stop_codon:yes gene_type:complete
MKIDIEKVKSSVDIVDVISNYVDMKKAGKNYHGCCPFHDEKTPSFTVAQDKQFYHCFGCGAHGDVIGFIMDYTNVDFREAVKSIDSNAFTDLRSDHVFVKKIRIPLALQQDRHENLEDIIDSCEVENGVYFSGSSQILPLTDLNGKIISLAMIEGKGLDIKYFNKKFTYGSCAIFGKLMESVIVTCDYWQALSVRELGANVICVFESLNLHFIITTARRFGIEPMIICNTTEDFIQAEKLHIHRVFNKKFGDYVVTEKYLDKELAR